MLCSSQTFWCLQRPKGGRSRHTALWSASSSGCQGSFLLVSSELLCAQLGKERSGEFHRHLSTSLDSLSNTQHTGQLCAVCAHGEAGSGSKDADTPTVTPYFRLKHVYLKVPFRAPSPGPPDSNGKKEKQQAAQSIQSVASWRTARRQSTGAAVFMP